MPTVLAAVELPQWVDPLAAYLSGPGREENGFWLDAGPDATDGWSLVGGGTPVARAPRTVDAAHPNGGARDAVGGPFRGGWVGWIGYDAAAPVAGAPAAGGDAFPPEAGLLVDRFVAFDHASRRAWAWAPVDDLDAYVDEVLEWAEHDAPTPTPDSRPDIRARHTAGEYAELVEQCRAAIREGDAYQLCLTTRFTAVGPVDPVAAYLSLRTLTPAPRGGIVRIGRHALLSASPESFLELRNGVIRTRPIKGTRSRGADDATDRRAEEDLRSSVKERAENVMIVDLMRNDLQRVCADGSVTVERLLAVESYAAVHQLVSTVSGTLRRGTTIEAILAATFPAGSMTGAPKLSAMTILHRLENAPRGIFAGCFGWIGDDGDADLAMIIRSIAVSPDEAYVGAGGGITWLSDPSAEVEEVAIKARAPLQALGAGLPDGWRHAPVR